MIAVFCLIISGGKLEISYDKFIRTTDPKHEAIVKEFYSRVLANGDIYRADYEGLYCVNCEEYKVMPWISIYFIVHISSLSLYLIRLREQ